MPESLATVHVRVVEGEARPDEVAALRSTVAVLRRVVVDQKQEMLMMDKSIDRFLDVQRFAIAFREHVLTHGTRVGFCNTCESRLFDLGEALGFDANRRPA